MRKKNGGLLHLAHVIEEDLEGRNTGLSKPHRIGLSDLAASVLACHSVNTSDLASVLPRDVKSDEERYRYINRWLSNDKINPVSVMQGFMNELLQGLSMKGQTIVLMLDQTKIRDGFECLMVSIKLEQRAIPLLWRVVETEGEIGFDIQKPLLKAVFEIIPNNIPIILMADRFYGNAQLIALCQSFKWQYRIRLKGNLILQHEGGEIQTEEILKLGLKGLEQAQFNRTHVVSNIGVIQEEGHEESWIIAMECSPNDYKTLDYGMRWGIESLFSDMKSRGFNVTKTQLKHAERIERLLLVLAVACYWAVSTGMQPKVRTIRSKKKPLAA